MAQRQWRSDDTDSWNEMFGDGSDGSTYSVPSNEGCSGTAAGTSLTLAAAGSFSNGMLVLIHQSRGTGVGNWELNKISSGGGTTSLTMAYDLMNTYTDSGSSQAQIIEMKQYDGVTTGAVTSPAWDQSKGGIIAFFDKGTATIDNTLTLSGNGYKGGIGRKWSNIGYDGEGTVGASKADNVTQNGSGGGGSYQDNITGGGGGNGAAGTGTGGNGGRGGDASGNAGLTSITFGGGGGGGEANASSGGNGGNGGDGGGMCFIFAKDISITGSIVTNGANGTNGYSTGTDSGGGGGAGGSVLLKCETATLGTSLITASGGSAGQRQSGGAGPGAVGRIHIDYSDSFTGTTSPTIDSRQDLTIIEIVATTNYLRQYRRTRIPGLIHGVEPSE